MRLLDVLGTVLFQVAATVLVILSPVLVIGTVVLSIGTGLSTLVLQRRAPAERSRTPWAYAPARPRSPDRGPRRARDGCFLSSCSLSIFPRTSRFTRTPHPSQEPMMTTAPTSTTRLSGLSLDQVDESVRIQDDLFGHVNGRWLREHEMPADRSSDGAFHALRDLSEERVREIIEEAAADIGRRTERRGPTTDHARVGILYRMFMDTDAIEKAGFGVLDELLDTITSTTDLEASPAPWPPPTQGRRRCCLRLDRRPRLHELPGQDPSGRAGPAG